VVEEEYPHYSRPRPSSTGEGIVGIMIRKHKKKHTINRYNRRLSAVSSLGNSNLGLDAGGTHLLVQLV
jgi:hypothetical protein